MKKVLNVFKVILLLAWLVFLVLCSHSCIMKLNSSMEEGTTPVSAAPASANAGDNTAAAPQQTKTDAVTLSSGDVSLTAHSDGSCGSLGSHPAGQSVGAEVGRFLRQYLLFRYSCLG